MIKANAIVDGHLLNNFFHGTLFLSEDTHKVQEGNVPNLEQLLP